MVKKSKVNCPNGWLNYCLSLFQQHHEKICLLHMSRDVRKWDFAYGKTKPWINCAVTAKLNNAFVFARQIEQSL